MARYPAPFERGRGEDDVEGARAEALPRIGLRIAVALIAALMGMHVMSQFLRNSVGVIAPNLAQDVGLGAAGIGLLSSAFFLSFAAAQIPVGIAIDRYGPRRVMASSVAIMVAGVLVFALGPDAQALILGRVLMGLGCSSFFMGPLVVYSRWFPPERFSTLTGLQLGVSGLGMLAATAPLAYGTATIGWRASFLIIAVVGSVLGLVMFLVVRDDPPGRARPRGTESLAEGLRGVGRVIRTPSFVPVFLMHLCGYSALVTVLGLWAGPYLSHIYGYDIEGRGNLLFLLAFVFVTMNLVWGPADRLFQSYKRPVLIGAVATTALLAWLAIVGRPATPTLITWFVLLGVAASFTPVLTAHGRALFPHELVGRGLTLMNLGTMLGVFVMQALTGAVVGRFAAPGGVYPLDAYRAAFAVEAVLLGVATLVYLRARDPLRPNKI
jgi:MFS family permease